MGDEAAPLSGIDGFLPFRGSLMLDLVVVAMVVVMLALGASCWLVKYRRLYSLHQWIQVGLGVVLLLTVVLFEIDMRINGWEDRAKPSVHYNTLVWPSLYVHLFFSVTTTFLWIYVIVQALRKIPNPPGPSPYSATHIFWARLAAIDMGLTAVTGWIFYYLAFVC